ncbi:fibronectin type III domain-containing protein [Winogradskyella sp.]
MKKITINVFVIMFLLGTFVSFAQTLNQPANWPNAMWTLSGAYTPAGLLGDPTNADANFIFDDDAAGNGMVDMIMVTSPVIDLTSAAGAGETWITISGNFTYRALGGDILAIEVYDADATTWSQLYQFAGNTTTTADYQNCTISEAYTTPPLDISGYTATQLSGFQYRVSYDDVGGWQYGYCVESPTITSAAPPSCIDPSMLSATGITDTSADLGWTENGTATIWNVEVVTSGTPATGTPTASGVTNPYTAMGLTANTAYDFYVQADCGGLGTSNWVGPFTFTTACTAIAAPYSEDFETFTTSTTPFSSENCWNANNSASFFWESAPFDDTSSSGTGPDSSVTTGNYFFTEASGSTAGNEANLVSPLIDLSGLTTPSLSFDYHMHGVIMGTLNVLVNGTDNVWSLSGEQQANATDPFNNTIIDLSAYAGQTISVTFNGISGGDWESDMAIDNVVFDELPACPAPSVLTATNITDTTADLGWTENGSATIWDIELGLDGFTPTGTPTNAGVANPYAATGLTENTDYDFYVRSDCSGSTSAWVGPFSFSTLETCPAPSALDATNIMETSADLSWTENGTATAWDIELVDVTAGGTATGTPTATGVGNPYNQMGLVGDNAYEFYVRADCGVDGVSAWAGPFAFNTPAAPPACGGVFVDSGGSSGSYSASESSSWTITPDNPGDAVTVTFTYVDIETATGAGSQDGCWDFMTIYNGPDNTFPVLAQTLCGEESGDGGVPSVPSSELNVGDSFTSTDASGALTIEFSSDTSVQETGWVADVTCNTLSVDDIENNASFSYYPNPVKNTLSLNAQNTIENVVMYNMLGQEVLRANPNAMDSELDMSNLQDGTYFVKVTIGNVAKTIRVIKQ